MQITESVRKIRGYAGFVKRATNSILKERRGNVARMNIDQLKDAKSPKGYTYDTYAPATVEDTWHKRTRKVYYGEPIKLWDTAAFYNGMFEATKVKKKNELEIYSKRTKQHPDDPPNLVEILEKEWKPFGLTEQNMKKFTEIVRKDLYKQLKDYFT